MRALDTNPRATVSTETRRPVDSPLACTVLDFREVDGLAPPPRRHDETFRRAGEKAEYVAALRRTLAPSGATLSLCDGAFEIRPCPPAPPDARPLRLR